ncbi:hypothetical protein B0H11DRAFT_2297175 [Mycena galericulata]|nr:hypothetical protein B0H11DRAFT_2297175 [Mycena galericulata]
MPQYPDTFAHVSVGSSSISTRLYIKSCSYFFMSLHESRAGTNVGCRCPRPPCHTRCKADSSVQVLVCALEPVHCRAFATGHGHYRSARHRHSVSRFRLFQIRVRTITRSKRVSSLPLTPFEHGCLYLDVSKRKARVREFEIEKRGATYM